MQAGSKQCQTDRNDSCESAGRTKPIKGRTRAARLAPQSTHVNNSHQNQRTEGLTGRGRDHKGNSGGQHVAPKPRGHLDIAERSSL